MDILTEKKELYYTLGVFYIFLILRNIAEVKKNTNSTTLPLSAIIVTAAAIPAIPILLVILCCFALYRLFIGRILKTIHGTNFGGLLSGSDAFHILGDSSNGITTCCFMVRCEKHSFKEFYDIMKGLVEKCFNFSKFKSTFNKSYNYSYMLKRNFDINDCVKRMKTIDIQHKRMEKADLVKLLDYHYNEPLPEGGKIPWQVIIGTQSVNWKEDEYDYYPMLMRVHHSIADGLTLIKLVIGIVGDKQQNNSFEDKPKILVKHNLLKKVMLIFQSIGLIAYLFYLLPSSIVVFFMYKGKDANILHKHDLSNEKVIGLSAEKNEEYVKKIKNIKKKISEVHFPTILLTAFSASLDNYYRKNCTEPPKHITATIPVVAGSSDMRTLVPGKLDLNDLYITNSYSLLLMNLPINIRDNYPKSLGNWPLINRLRLISQEANILKNATDYQVNYLVVKLIFAILPLSFLEGLLKKVNCTSVISILAGPPKITYSNGLLVLSDVIPWVPNIHNIATSICAITYDGRLQIGLSADRAVIPSQKDAQSIVDDIYKYLDILEEEVQEFSKA